ncbi:hypothetical protein M6D81_05230 [Paenibacillus sp. J5C_2022]|uniref:transaldolase family protein n=1 Tax=Paenibacillus sp. J5C2022 TaxID=2977129 RepID=UPI0021D14C76|nr:transaldolase family protein [Paenibacillus sp. J5C2022]MCU6708108.1 hypothetical protein [Paenibacillus sp. J5C2022]
MKLWLCGNDLDRIADWLSYDAFEGILTNPDIVANAKMDKVAFFTSLCEISNGPVFYQLQSGDEVEMLRDASRMLDIDTKMRIKVPATRSGMRVISRLTAEGHSVLATCVPDLTTMLMAVRFGAQWITPYGSIWHPFGQVDKETLLKELSEVLRNQQLSAQIIAGVKDPVELRRFTLAGIDNFFIWDKDIECFFDLPMVLRSEANFEKSWNTINVQS